LIPLVIFLVLYAIAASLTGAVNAASSNFTIFPTNSTLNGVPYKELIAKWWMWDDSIPNDIHPLKKYPDAERCSAMQNGEVWFLPNVLPGTGKVNYQCNIPFGKVIMVPLSVTDCESGATEEKMTDEELKDCAFNIITPLSQIEVSIDGEKIDTSKLGVPIKTDFFNVTYPSNPIDVFGAVKPGTYRTIAEGYVLFFHDLPLGKHIIHTKVVDVLKGKEYTKGLGEPATEATYDISIQ
jgi:hypothetical protein